MFRRSTKKKKKKDFPEPAGLEMVNPALTPKANRFEKGEEGPSVVQLHRNTAFRNPDYEIGANEEYENIDGSLTGKLQGGGMAVSMQSLQVLSHPPQTSNRLLRSLFFLHSIAH